MGRAVLAQPDGVMGVDVDAVRGDQGRHANRVAGIVRKHQEGGVVRDEPAMQRDPGADCRHAEFPHPEIDVIAVRGAIVHIHALRPDGVVGSGQVRRSADQLRQQRPEGVERRLRRLARRHVLALGLLHGDDACAFLRPVAGQFTAHAPLELGRGLREGRAIAVHALVPGCFGSGAGLAGIPPLTDLRRYLERRMIPAQRPAGPGNLVGSQR